MNIQFFVSFSACLLLGWLGATFFHAVPTQNYPKLMKASVPAADVEQVDIIGDGAVLNVSTTSIPQ